MSDDQIVAIFRRAGMLPGLVLVARLLDMHAARDMPEPEWKGMSLSNLEGHMMVHTESLYHGERTDPDSGQPTIAHVAARALQLATLAALEKT